MPDLDSTAIPNFGERMRLDDKVYVVFGAGNGIGRQCAHALAQLGAKVVCVGRSAEATNKVANEVGGMAMRADVTKRDDTERLFAETWSSFGHLHGIVDIVALNRPVPFKELREPDWDWQFHNVLLHAVHALQIGAPLIAKSGGGSVTFVGSVAGLLATIGPFHYGVFKAALHHLTLLAGVELGPSNVRVNCVVPGLTITPRLIELFGQAKIEEMAREYPLGRMPDASDVANAILFMASDLARNITSQVLVVDGGASVRAAPPITPKSGLG